MILYIIYVFYAIYESLLVPSSFFPSSMFESGCVRLGYLFVISLPFVSFVGNGRRSVSSIRLPSFQYSVRLSTCLLVCLLGTEPNRTISGLFVSFTFNKGGGPRPHGPVVRPSQTQLSRPFHWIMAPRPPSLRLTPERSWVRVPSPHRRKSRRETFRSVPPSG